MKYTLIVYKINNLKYIN